MSGITKALNPVEEDDIRETFLAAQHEGVRLAIKGRFVAIASTPEVAAHDLPPGIIFRFDLFPFYFIALAVATFNVPIEDARHADRAVEAASVIMARIASGRFGNEALDIRIGVNTGPLIAGNVTGRDLLNRARPFRIRLDLSLTLRAAVPKHEQGRTPRPRRQTARYGNRWWDGTKKKAQRAHFFVCSAMQADNVPGRKMPNQPVQRRLAAVLAADVAGYTRLMEQDTDGTVAAWTSARDEVIEPVVATHGGRVVKLTGDGFLVEFPTVQDAVRCAIALQQGFAASALEFRMGVNLGDILDDGRDIHGEGVNIAARIEALADAGGISISASVYEQVRNRIEVRYEDRGEHAVKHVSTPVRVYAIRLAGAAPKGPAPPPLPDKPSVAVLPFENMSRDPEQDYFADGITEDIITEISKVDALLVISRNSTFTYKGKAAKAQDICRDLGVRHLVEGSVRKAGHRVRVTAQLIDGQTGGHVWADRFDRALVDVFAVQDEITGQIVRALEVNLVKDRSARVDTAVLQAYDCFLRGREQYRLFTQESNASARHLFEAAVKLDVNYAAAYAGLALTRLHEWFMGSQEALDEAYRLALRASELGSSLPLVYEALGNVLLFRRQHDEAIAAARRWLELEPNNADGHANLAGALMFSGEPEQVIPLVDKAMRLNPFYPFYYILYKGQAYLGMRRYEDALEALQRSVAHNPEALPAHLYHAACTALMGLTADAGEALAKAHRIYPDISTTWVRTYFPYKRSADLELLIDGLRKAGLPA